MNTLLYFYYFFQFIKDFDKSYDQSTFLYRFPIFMENVQYIETMNQQVDSPFRLHINQYADLSKEEFVKYFTGSNFSSGACAQYKSTNVTDIPDSVDWRTKNIITPVKDQGQCGSCWAFAVTEVLESVYALKTGDLEVLSPQELVDCDKSSYGCQGGYPEQALLYVEDHGLELEKDYPYTATDGTCKSSGDTKYKLNKCFEVPPNNEKVLKEAVSQAPVVGLIEADQRVFQFYKSGVIPSSQCGTSLDHAIQIVGYGTDNGKDYWLVRNSWGSSWGENGYVRLERTDSENNKGTCGLAMGPIGFYTS